MVTWSYSSLYSGEWNNIECNNLRGYVCQTYKGIPYTWLTAYSLHCLFIIGVAVTVP